MNLSGKALKKLLKKLSLQLDQVLVIHDEADLEQGRIKLKMGGGTGGHRGLDSIAQVMGDREFLRLRVGVGRPSPGEDLSDYLLTSVPQQLMETLAKAGAQALEELLEKGVVAAMNQVNSAPK